MVMVPYRMQEDVLSMNREHDAQAQAGTDFEDTLVKPPDARAGMLVRVSEDLGQARHGRVDVRMITLGNSLNRAQV